MGGADFSPRHSVARGPARKPGPHTQRKLPGAFSQRPGAQGGGTRRHSSMSEGTEGIGQEVTKQSPPALPPSTPSVWLTNAVCALRAEPETGITRTGVATGPRDAASWAADLGIALTYTHGGTWGVSSQPGSSHPSLNSLSHSSQYNLLKPSA